MPMPKIDAQNRKRPLCYDPVRGKFIYFDEIVTHKEEIVPPARLSEADLKKLVMERWRTLPADTTSQAISGPPYPRDELIRAIEQDEPFGRMTVEAEKSSLTDLLEQIRRNLK
jgi:hypothetical protein